MLLARDACRPAARRSPGRGGFTLIELLVVMAIMLILAGIVSSTIFVFQRMMKKKAAGVDIQTFTMGLAQYKKEFGSYPPDDITLLGGTDEHGRNEVIYYYLGRRHQKGPNLYGPYVTFKTNKLRDADKDGYEEYVDPFGGLYEYGIVKDQSGVVVRYEIVCPGFDGQLGGLWDTGGDDEDGDPLVVGEFVVKYEDAAKDNESAGGE